MRWIFLAPFVVLSSFCFGQAECGELLDSNNDGFIGVEDLMNLLSHFGDQDLDFDGVFDSVDDCVGFFDECGVCNGPGIPEGYCSCTEVLDALGVCGGNCLEDSDGDGICDVWGAGCQADSILFNGYWYDLVQIGEQCWFAENLQTTKYANGDDISNLTTVSNEEWQYADSGAYSNYQYWNLSEVEMVSLYGRLYNQFAVQDERGLCPNDWHVPHRLEFEELIESVGGEEEAGDALKSSPEDTPSWTGNNSSGFSGTPGGVRNGPFSSFGSQGFWWSQTFTETVIVPGLGEVGTYWIFRLNNSGVDPLSEPSIMGTSIRCIKD